jgi:NAD(P)-dependent dehydrogenase (short-subunit alcohol dehydrogenase family)
MTKQPTNTPTPETFEAINKKTLSRRQVLSRGGAGLAGLALGSAGLASAQTSSDVTAGTNRFTDRVVLITGATSGIGEVTAYAFAREGASVFFCGRREELGRAVEASINADDAVVQTGGEATYMQADVRVPEQVEVFVSACVERYGRIDVAFNNAGVVFGLGDLQGNMPLAEIETAAFDDVWSTNTRGIFLALKHEVPILLATNLGVATACAA